jgi:hypothetical protein
LPTEAEHFEQFEHNARIAKRMADSADFDWAVTVLFYAALHLVQVYIVRKGVRVENHWERDRYILASAELRPILDSYRALRVHSENTRYKCRKFLQSEFDEIRNRNFVGVVEHLRLHLQP